MSSKKIDLLRTLNHPSLDTGLRWSSDDLTSVYLWPLDLGEHKGRYKGSLTWHWIWTVISWSVKRLSFNNLLRHHLAISQAYWVISSRIAQWLTSSVLIFTGGGIICINRSNLIDRISADFLRLQLEYTCNNNCVWFLTHIYILFRGN